MTVGKFGMIKPEAKEEMCREYFDMRLNDFSLQKALRFELAGKVSAQGYYDHHIHKRKLIIDIHHNLT